MTRVLRVHPRAPEAEAIDEAAAIIRRGGLVAFPTETVYGLGANALDPAAVARIFHAKGRPADDPVIVHLLAATDLPRVARHVPPVAERLARAHWPGPLTLLLPKSNQVPEAVTAGLGTLAVRVPRHPVALALLRASGVPIAAPSANQFGHTSPTTAEHVLHDLGGRIDLVLDGGPTPLGVESTVLDVTRTPPVILRPGGLTREAIETMIGEVILRDDSRPERASGPEGPQPSPGMLARHYAPRAALTLVTGAREPALEQMASIVGSQLRSGLRVGLLAVDEDLARLASSLPVHADPNLVVRSMGPIDDPAGAAQRLFASLRDLEAAGVEAIVAHELPARGLGLAVNDRLRRAAERIVVAENG